jgi:hypothetical protein
MVSELLECGGGGGGGFFVNDRLFRFCDVAVGEMIPWRDDGTRGGFRPSYLGDGSFTVAAVVFWATFDVVNRIGRVELLLFVVLVDVDSFEVLI